ncbi:hypothetical protein QUF75_01230 [Desulfococcaceae bacterium HSG7]|nr:hypothetical protein [Desulfococcaceae bacterium HSG7]
MNKELEHSLSILRLDSDASPDEAEKAYKHLMNVWRPDRFASISTILQLKAIEKSREIESAYALAYSFLSAVRKTRFRRSDNPREIEMEDTWELSRADIQAELQAFGPPNVSAKASVNDASQTQKDIQARAETQAKIREKAQTIAKLRFQAEDKARTIASSKMKAYTEKRALEKAQKRMNAIQIYVFGFMTCWLVLIWALMDIKTEQFTLFNILALIISIPACLVTGNITINTNRRAPPPSVNKETALFFFISFFIVGFFLIGFYPFFGASLKHWLISLGAKLKIYSIFIEH